MLKNLSRKGKIKTNFNWKDVKLTCSKKAIFRVVKGQGGQVKILDIKSIYCTVVYCTRSHEKGGRECVGSSRTVCVSFEIAL